MCIVLSLVNLCQTLTNAGVNIMLCIVYLILKKQKSVNITVDIRLLHNTLSKLCIVHKRYYCPQRKIYAYMSCSSLLLSMNFV